ncbi:transferase family protein [Xylariaceae sp. FL1019]|nr:transferase family protein [Xylariaceae sp. FL1019]
MESTRLDITGSVVEDDKSSTRAPRSEQDVKDISRQILQIVFEYALNKIDHSEAGFERGAQNFMPVVSRFVADNQTVEACLPAFPFKSANKVYKVLGKLPDKAEELALERLQTMCKRIQAIYSPGARITIISDGITYNDLLSISDQDTWAYGEAIRAMAAEKEFDRISFSRMKDLLDLSIPEEMREIVYVANCTNFRRLLLNRHGDPDLDIDNEISTNPDTKLTYLGYKRFLESDLKHIFPQGANRTANSYKRDCKYLAKQMLIRGYAFAGAVKTAFPNHLRLSIHESIGAVAKISISLLNTTTGFTTPWHCTVAQLANGDWISAPMGEFTKNSRMELVHVNGAPSHFVEISDGTDNPSIVESLTKSKPISTSEYFSRASTPSTTRSNSASPRQGPHLHSEVATPGTETSFSIAPSTCDSIPEENNVSHSGSHELPQVGSYGRRLIPQIMDALAVNEPARTVFSLAAISGESLNFTHISARNFAQAVDNTAWWLLRKAGRPDSVQPIGYIGPHDLRHVLLTYACVKVGYAALFLSPKNSTEGTLAVLEATKCSVWVTAAEVSPIPVVKDVLEKRPMKVLKLPLLEKLLDASKIKPFPYVKTFDEATNDPFCFLHTSGTTGVPKPIPWSHGLIGTMDAVRLMPPVAGDDGLLPWTADWKAGDTIYSSFPMSHGAGIIMDILMPALYDLRCVLGPVSAIPNIDLIGNLAETAKIDIWSMVPSLVDELGETPEILEKLRPSKFICASGGPVGRTSAGKANEVIRVLNLTGTTEGLFIGNLVPSREDWFWFCFHPSSGFEFKQLDDDTYEHWVHRNDEWSLFQGIFHTFPEKDSVNFKDLYMRHPTKPNLWAFKGRSDDLVVLSNGYKISPLETEAYITTHPAVEGCLVFGTGKPQAGLLIELKDPSNKSEELLESIWKIVEEANRMSRHKNQLLKNFITFAQADKPFFRTDKRTIKRPATLALYADYIERFYSSVNDEEPIASTPAIDTTSAESVQSGVLEIIRASLHGAEGEIDPGEDLFQLGLDSLGAMSAIKSIRLATGLTDQISPRHVYSNPTISKLSAVISKMVIKPKKTTQALTTTPGDNATSKFDRMVTQYKAHQTFKLNAWDHVHGKSYFSMVFYIPLRKEASFEETFDLLQSGLNRTFDLIPALAGKVIDRSEQEVGYFEGERALSVPSPAMLASLRDRLKYNDLSDVLPSFAELRAKRFPPSILRDKLLMDIEPFFQLPADVMAAQANFVEGGCILATEFNHCCLDGIGGYVAMRAWAENCRYIQGDLSATCDWYHPESSNHSLLDVIQEYEGWAKPVSEIDPGTWSFLQFQPDDERAPTASEAVQKTWTLPPRPKYPPPPIWPAHRAERSPRTTLFRISAEKLACLKEHVLADTQTLGFTPSISDIVQAFWWRAGLRARYRVATEIRKQTFGPDDIAILESVVDGRPFFSELLPSTYMGSLLLFNRPSMPVETFCSPSTSVAQVARLIRDAGARITPQVAHDTFCLYQNIEDRSRFGGAGVGLEHMHTLISNVMMFSTDELGFGERLFDDGGIPFTMRPQLERHVGRFRINVIFPMTKDGSVELVCGTHPEELDMLQKDEEFSRYADLIDVGY